MDAVCGEAIKEGTCEIQEIPSTATPLELLGSKSALLQSYYHPL